MLINTYKSNPKLVVKVLLFIISFILYAHTISFSTALDDGLVLPESIPGCENPFTDKGFSGIPILLQTDGYQFYYDKLNAAPELTGGRYRPLSLVTFAIEHSLYSGFSKAIEVNLMHFMNVLLYAILSLVVFEFLYSISRQKLLLAGILTAIFILLPMHTEVVANIKSRDEILALLFGLSSYLSLIRYQKKSDFKQLIFSILFLFLALLSKENAVIFILLHPIIFFFLFKNKTIAKRSLIAFLSLFAVYFFGVRNYAIQHRAELNGDNYSIELIERNSGTESIEDDKDIFNNPFLLASASEATASKIAIIGEYFVKQFIPYEMSFDYGYNHVKMKTFSSPVVLGSILLIAGLLFSALLVFKSKNEQWIQVGIGAQLFLASIFLVSNLVFDIGATMGDRLIFQASLGGVMLMGFTLQNFSLFKQKNFLIGLITLLIGVYGYLSIDRASNWKSNSTLFLHDVAVVPNSLKANNAAGSSSLRKYYELDSIYRSTRQIKDSINAVKSLVTGLQYLQKAEQLYIDPRKQDKYFSYDNYIVKNLINQTYAHYYLKQYALAEVTLQKAKSIKPSEEDIQTYETLLSDAYYAQGMRAAQNNQPQDCLAKFAKAVQYAPKDYTKWYNYGGAAYTYGQYQIAFQAFSKALEIKPGDPESRNGLAATQQQLVQLN